MEAVQLIRLWKEITITQYEYLIIYIIGYKILKTFNLRSFYNRVNTYIN